MTKGLIVNRIGLNTTPFLENPNKTLPNVQSFIENELSLTGNDSN